MRRSAIVLLTILLIFGGGIAYLVTADMPAPQQKIEKVLENDRFLK